ncbi:carbohydrate-binding family 9-like protein [Flavobacterium foetidum]|uniref:carbohydrate-binding family 9-like protein n=1 Tax=Flavobacterium foetidum TaxID=2026681 RepID=UPI0010755806|nr:carbohydrate-binding family 9-like protein [Flavobacterium foetidum]KAF2513813.1 hypothetical protein E0W73_13375 [Flavobacterium foetidum]
MNTKVFYCLCLIITGFANYAQHIPIYKTSKEIRIDGDLSEWKAPFLGTFKIHNSGEKASQNTFVALSWNENNLYVAYRVEDAEIIGKLQPKDSKIYETDDLVEIFIDPDGDGKNYLEIGVNAFSTYYDMLIKCISPDCGGWNTSIDFDVSGLETASKTTINGFTTEIKIPFAGLVKIKDSGFKIPKNGTKWKGNLFRIDYGKIIEYQALQPYNSAKFGFHQPEEFAVFEFVEY